MSGAVTSLFSSASNMSFAASHSSARYDQRIQAMAIALSRAWNSGIASSPVQRVSNKKIFAQPNSSHLHHQRKCSG
jgi:hypothetical protein